MARPGPARCHSGPARFHSDINPLHLQKYVINNVNEEKPKIINLCKIDIRLTLFIASRISILQRFESLAFLFIGQIRLASRRAIALQTGLSLAWFDWDESVISFIPLANRIAVN